MVPMHLGCTYGTRGKIPAHPPLFQCRRTLAALVPLEGHGSPTRPPCGLAPILGAGGWGILSRATRTAKVLWERQEKGGWVGMPASAATLAANVLWQHGAQQR
jgi:hypothetical protein